LNIKTIVLFQNKNDKSLRELVESESKVMRVRVEGVPGSVGRYGIIICALERQQCVVLLLGVRVFGFLFIMVMMMIAWREKVVVGLQMRPLSATESKRDDCCFITIR